MRLTRVIGLCLIASFAIGATATASASAELPALFECAKATKETVVVNGKPKSVYTGKYTEKKCATLAPAGKYRAEGKPEGKYEFQEWSLAAKGGKALPFTGKGKAANLEVKNQNGVACTSSSDTGTFATPKTAKGIEVTFKGCAVEGVKCTNTGVVGEIKTNTLEGEVGYISGKGTKAPVVGILVRPESGKVAAAFHCQTLNLLVEGSVIGEVATESVGVFTKKATLVFEQSAAKQKFTKFEGRPSQELLTCEQFETPCSEGGADDISAEETEVTNTGKEELELMA